MQNILTTRVLIGLATLLLAGPAWAQQVSSTVSEDNGATTNDFDGNQDVYGTPNHPAVITSGNGYDFTTATLPSSIGQITITLTVFDGNSGIGDFDFDHLHLYLGGTATFLPNVFDGNQNIVTYTGGVDTGILLNGFEGGGFTNTLTFTANVDPTTTGSAILAEIASHGGFLPAYIVTDNATDDTLATPNEMIVGNPDIFDATTTLILAVPEPSTYFAAAFALLAMLTPKIRRWRKAG